MLLCRPSSPRWSTASEVSGSGSVLRSWSFFGGRPGLGEGIAGAAQGAGEPDQWQTDECRGVRALDAFKQRDPESLRLEASCAVERLFALDVAFDLGGREGAEDDRCCVE